MDNTLLKKMIFNAVIIVLEEIKPNPDDPLEYYLDDIMLKTLDQCATYFLKQKYLRQCERDILVNLQTNIKNGLELTQIEEQLYRMLTQIKPRWGELFGTDRGQVYNTFIALNEWTCFSWHTRLHYHHQREKKQQRQVEALSTIVTRQKEQLSTASQLLQNHESITQSMTERIANQFITIQELRQENTSLAKESNEKQNQKKTISEKKRIEYLA